MRIALISGGEGWHVCDLRRAAQAQGHTVHLQRTLDERLDAVSQRVGLGLTEQASRTAQSLGQLKGRDG